MSKVKVEMTYDANIGDSGRSFVQVRETTTRLDGIMAGTQTVKTGFYPVEVKNVKRVVDALRNGQLIAVLGKRVPNQTLFTVTIAEPGEIEQTSEAAEETVDGLKHD
jgi:hypothetical protein